MLSDIQEAAFEGMLDFSQQFLGVRNSNIRYTHFVFFNIATCVSVIQQYNF